MRAMLSTLTLTLTLTLVMITFAPAPASADFHPVCTGFATAYANVGLEAQSDPYSPDTLTYSGVVSCPDSMVTITSLQLYDTSGEEPVLVNETQGEPCHSSLTQMCRLEATVMGDAGQYEVRMLFDADDPHTPETEFEDVPRRGGFEYLGSGQPVPTCTSVGFFPVQLPPGC